MAGVTVEYNCGCGFRSKRLEAAEEHSDGSHHIMTIAGGIKPSTDAPFKPTRKTSTRPANKPKPKPEPVVQDDTTTQQIADLRHKLGDH